MHFNCETIPFLLLKSIPPHFYFLIISLLSYRACLIVVQFIVVASRITSLGKIRKKFIVLPHGCQLIFSSPTTTILLSFCVWQFIQPTPTNLGLRCSWLVDWLYLLPITAYLTLYVLLHLCRQAKQLCTWICMDTGNMSLKVNTCYIDSKSCQQARPAWMTNYACIGFF